MALSVDVRLKWPAMFFLKTNRAGFYPCSLVGGVAVGRCLCTSLWASPEVGEESSPKRSEPLGEHREGVAKLLWG